VRDLYDRFPATRVVVVGDSVLDRWMYGAATRLCREAPLPVIDVQADEAAPGAAANAAVNVASLGGQVSFVSRVGADAGGDELRTLLRRAGVSDEWVVRDDAFATPTKHRLVCDGQPVARYDHGRPRSPSSAVGQRVADALREAMADADAVLVGDYGYQLLNPELIGRQRHIPLVIDAHDLGPWASTRATAVVPNLSEAATLLGIDPGGVRGAFLDEYGPRLLDRSGAAMVVVTLDADGAVLHRRGRRPYRTHTTPVPSGQTTGAGDTFAAAFTLALAADAEPREAVDVGQAAASVVVRGVGTATCSRHDLVGELSNGGPLVPAERLALSIEEERVRGRRIVFTNGCFDVLHRGHVAYLQQARSLGDRLVVAVNSDGSVRRLKGPGRPVNPVEDRVAVLAALSCVDYVTVFEEDTPQRLLELVRPDLYVKGGDYLPSMLPETPVVERLGGEVRILDYVENRSTTALIDRIRASDSLA
jgi:D-beta-D-heptose 7-phosphate kinase / D-beta-D-heptose 1-phosphate adenosyltransferase